MQNHVTQDGVLERRTHAWKEYLPFTTSNARQYCTFMRSLLELASFSIGIDVAAMFLRFLRFLNYWSRI